MNRVPDMNQGVDGVDASVHSDVEERGQLDQKAAQQPAQQPVKPPATYSRWGITQSGQAPATQYWPAHSGSPDSTPAQNAGNNALPLKDQSSKNQSLRNQSFKNQSLHAGGQSPPSNTPNDAGNSSAPFSSPSFRAGGQLPTASTAQQDDNNSLTLSPSFRAGGKAPSSTGLSASPANPAPNSVIENNSINPTRRQSLFNGFDTNPGQNGLGNSQRLKSDSSSASSQRVIDGVLPPYSEYQSELNDTSYSMSHLFPHPTSPSKRDLAAAKKRKLPPQKSLGNYHAGPVKGFNGAEKNKVIPGLQPKSNKNIK
jgi:hypothetical protein